ncbi:MAG: Na+/H+ antiporter subunit E [Thiobacillaceae bacterium]|nr:Na+/H+ antiporter subunit E [Thiobacillaceae bacterium]
MRRALAAGALLAALWWVLTEGAGGYGLGALFIALALAWVLRQPRTGTAPRLRGAIGFAAFFLRQSLLGGLQVARLALVPAARVRPQLLELRLNLPPGPATQLLAAALNLMPGTLCVHLAGRRLVLHVLDARMPVEPEVRAAEAQLARLFGFTS